MKKIIMILAAMVVMMAMVSPAFASGGIQVTINSENKISGEALLWYPGGVQILTGYDLDLGVSTWMSLSLRPDQRVSIKTPYWSKDDIRLGENSSRIIIVSDGPFGMFGSMSLEIGTFFRDAIKASGMQPALKECGRILEKALAGKFPSTDSDMEKLSRELRDNLVDVVK